MSAVLFILVFNCSIPHTKVAVTGFSFLWERGDFSFLFAGAACISRKEI